MQALVVDQGSNNLVDQLLKGEPSLMEVTYEAIQAWLSAIQETSNDMVLPKICSAISVEEFQTAFKAVNERTSSSPSNLHYSIWKVVSQEDNLAESLGIMMSTPFMYGFVNTRWSTVVDVVLKKKNGNRKIHHLRIPGILEVDFNTALKILFAEKLMPHAKATGLHDEQW